MKHENRTPCLTGVWSSVVLHWRQGFQSNIARRFVLLTVLTSSVLALFITAVQLFVDYKLDLSKLNYTIRNIENTRTESLVESLWNIDEPLIASQLEGILNLDGVARVAIISQDGETAFNNTKKPDSTLHYSFPLSRFENNQEFELGELQLVISLDEVYQKLISRGLIVLLSNAVKSLLVAAAIILIYQILIGQHITKISRFASQYDSLETNIKFKLNRAPKATSNSDELGDVESAINQWITNNEDNQSIQRSANAELAQHRDSLRELNKKLNLVNTELTQFTYSASHDLKAPLTTISGLLSFTVEDIQAGKTDDAIKIVMQSKELADRLAMRIEDMLALASSDIDNDDWETVCIEEIIDEIWQDNANVKDSPIAVLTKCLGHDKPLVTVQVRIRMVLENLFSNALKYTNDESDKTEILITTQCIDNSFVLSISDNGAGIPAQCHHRVFQVFQRFSDSSKPGSGLGLAIVKKNIQHLGGEITFTSTNQGTQFRISLPLKEH